MSKNGSDPIKPWFIAAEELGEFIGIRFGYLPYGHREPEWTFLPHTEFDGIGGFAELLRKRGAILDRVPQIKHASASSTLSLLKALPKYFSPRRRVQWRPLKGAKRLSEKTNPPMAVAWHVFDETSTTQIRRVCRKASVTVNSFLLKHLTKAVRPFLQDESSVVPWMIPVNLRGKVKREKDTDNHSSYVGVRVRSFETIFDIHHSIYAALASGEHWANWYAYKSGRCLTHAMRKGLLAKELCMSQWNLGSFSNLGDWDPGKQIGRAACRGAWLFAPPVLRCQVVGAGCVTFQNQLSLTLQIHPELTISSEMPEQWIRDWVKEIEIDLESVLSKPVYMHTVAA